MLLIVFVFGALLCALIAAEQFGCRAFGYAIVSSLGAVAFVALACRAAST